jgi:tetratricopeptide (TPR) repeat protein
MSRWSHVLAGSARPLGLLLPLAVLLAAACQPETVVQACGYRGYALFGEEIIRACDARLATSGLTARERAAALSARASARSDHDKDGRLADIDLAIRLEPDRAEAYSQRAAVHARAGDYDRAVADYDQAIRLGPNYIDYFRRGQVLSAKGAHTRAIADFDEVLRRRPGDEGWILPARAEAWLRAGRVERAIADYDEVLRRYPSSIGTRGELCWVRVIANRGEEARADCDAAAEDYFARTIALSARGVQHLRANRIDAAIADFDAALERQPYLERALYGRGLSRLRKGERAQGRADIDAAVAIQPSIVRDMTRYGLKP